MLNKSKRSALLLSIIIVLSFTFSSAIVTMLIPYLLSSDIHTIIEHPENLNTSQALFSLAALLLILLLILIAVTSYSLYRFFGEAYYGQRGALRWFLFGISFPIIGRLPGMFFPNPNGSLAGLWQFLSIFLAYALTRKLIPLKK